ncbi:hypothetical protein [Lysinibacillus yapensis]|uniref:hypothetical protein n=1 Tax=Ureibacillus yapensis TaxID=2304605 RepID=UPI0011C36073|nr:hypothetical protein [Lysinibacillus yapensis]
MSMWDTIVDILGIIIGTAAFITVIYFAIFMIVQIVSGIRYFFKWRKMSPAERAYEKRNRKRKYSSSSGDGWWSFDSGGSADGGGGDCGGGSGGD